VPRAPAVRPRHARAHGVRAASVSCAPMHAACTPARPAAAILTRVKSLGRSWFECGSTTSHHLLDACLLRAIEHHVAFPRQYLPLLHRRYKLVICSEPEKPANLAPLAGLQIPSNPSPHRRPLTPPRHIRFFGGHGTPAAASSQREGGGGNQRPAFFTNAI
jgi:hypothetical protein